MELAETRTRGRGGGEVDFGFRWQAFPPSVPPSSLPPQAISSLLFAQGRRVPWLLFLPPRPSLISHPRAGSPVLWPSPSSFL